MQCVPSQTPLLPLVGFLSSNPSEQAIHPNRSLNITESFDHDDGDDNDDGDGDDDGDDDDDDDDELKQKCTDHSLTFLAAALTF